MLTSADESEMEYVDTELIIVFSMTYMFPLQLSYVASLWHDSLCHEACYWNEIDDLRALLEGGGDRATLLVNAPGRDDWTALHTASFMNRLEAAEMLLHADAAIGLATACGHFTALHLACHRGHGEMVALLLRFMKRQS